MWNITNLLCSKRWGPFNFTMLRGEKGYRILRDVSLVQRGKSMTLITHLHLVPRHKMNGALPPLPLYAFNGMAFRHRGNIYLITEFSCDVGTVQKWVCPELRNKASWSAGPLYGLNNCFKLIHSINRSIEMLIRYSLEWRINLTHPAALLVGCQIQSNTLWY
jgi:hypothetical protein